MASETIINLDRSFFERQERTFARHGGLTVRRIRFEWGGEAVRVRGSRGEFTVLPSRASRCGTPASTTAC